MRPYFRMTSFSHSQQPYKISRPVRAPTTEFGFGGGIRTTAPPVFDPGASPLLMAGHRQVISGISKGSQNILIYNFIITTFGCQGGSQGGSISARAFSRARPGVALPLNQKLQFRQNNTAYYDTFFHRARFRYFYFDLIT